MADSKINVPGGMGGLMRYDEEYDSRFMLSPMHVIIIIILMVILVIGLKIFWPLPV